MKIINQFRRKARVVESTTDMKQVAMAVQQQAEYYTPLSEDEYPVILTISVQVKVCFVWLRYGLKVATYQTATPARTSRREQDVWLKYWRAKKMDNQNKRPE